MNDFPKKTDKRAATALACDIAHTHPDRFNEAVHAGFYPCAPKTRPGRARSFDVNDVIALRLYQRFLDNGMSAKASGHKACRIREFLNENPDTDQLYIVQPSIGSLFYLTAFDTKSHHAPEGPNAPDVLSVEVWNFHYLRGRIVHEIEEAGKVVGNE